MKELVSLFVLSQRYIARFAQLVLHCLTLTQVAHYCLMPITIPALNFMNNICYF